MVYMFLAAESELDETIKIMKKVLKWGRQNDAQLVEAQSEIIQFG